jgi:hypothetical protein
MMKGGDMETSRYNCMGYEMIHYISWLCEVEVPKGQMAKTLWKQLLKIWTFGQKTENPGVNKILWEKGKCEFRVGMRRWRRCTLWVGINTGDPRDAQEAWAEKGGHVQQYRWPTHPLSCAQRSEPIGISNCVWQMLSSTPSFPHHSLLYPPFEVEIHTFHKPDPRESPMSPHKQ